MKRNFKVITFNQHSCTKALLVRTADQNHVFTAVSSNSYTSHQHPMWFGYFCSLFAFANILANSIRGIFQSVLKRCTFQIAYCIDDANLDRLNEIQKRWERTDSLRNICWRSSWRPWNKKKKKKNYSVCIWKKKSKKGRELDKCIVYSEPFLNLSIHFMTLKSRLNPIIVSICAQSYWVCICCHLANYGQSLLRYT